MVTMSLKEAFAIALQEMQAMTADELRAELLLHRNGSLAIALREAREFLFSSHYSVDYPICNPKALLADETTIAFLQSSPELLWKIWAANDNSYALAA